MDTRRLRLQTRKARQPPDPDFDKLPSTIPEYYPEYPEARLEDVVGNEEALFDLRASALRVISGDERLGMRERLLIHGLQGTGKNYAVDAVLNHYAEKSSIRVYSIKKELLSSYINRPSRILEHIADVEQGERGIINILNEADGLFKANGRPHDETIKLISTMKEVMDRTQGIGWWIITNNPGYFEAAMGSRLLSVQFPGAQTKDEYSALFKIKLRHCDMDEEDYSLLADEYMEQSRQVLECTGQEMNGRGIAEICANALPTRYIVEHEQEILAERTLEYDRISRQTLINKIRHHAQGFIDKNEGQQRYETQHSGRNRPSYMLAEVGVQH